MGEVIVKSSFHNEIVSRILEECKNKRKNIINLLANDGVVGFSRDLLGLFSPLIRRILPPSSANPTISIPGFTSHSLLMLQEILLNFGDSSFLQSQNVKSVAKEIVEISDTLGLEFHDFECSIESIIAENSCGVGCGDLPEGVCEGGASGDIIWRENIIGSVESEEQACIKVKELATLTTSEPQKLCHSYLPNESEVNSHEGGVNCFDWRRSSESCDDISSASEVRKQQFKQLSQRVEDLKKKLSTQHRATDYVSPFRKDVFLVFGGSHLHSIKGKLPRDVRGRKVEYKSMVNANINSLVSMYESLIRKYRGDEVHIFITDFDFILRENPTNVIKELERWFEKHRKYCQIYHRCSTVDRKSHCIFTIGLPILTPSEGWHPQCPIPAPLDHVLANRGFEEWKLMVELLREWCQDKRIPCLKLDEKIVRWVKNTNLRDCFARNLISSWRSSKILVGDGKDKLITILSSFMSSTCLPPSKYSKN